MRFNLPAYFIGHLNTEMAGFRAIAQTLPISSTDAVIEDKHKRIVRTAMRLNESRGVKTGTALDDLIELKERTDERGMTVSCAAR